MRMTGNKEEYYRQSFASSSTAPNLRLEVNRMNSRIKYSFLSVFHARRKGVQEDEKRARRWEQIEADSGRDEAKQGSLYLITNSKSPTGNEGALTRTLLFFTTIQKPSYRSPHAHLITTHRPFLPLPLHHHHHSLPSCPCLLLSRATGWKDALAFSDVFVSKIIYHPAFRIPTCYLSVT